MAALAWYYMDHSNDTLYWSYSNEMSNTEFAQRVSVITRKRIFASDTSSSYSNKDLEKHQRWADNVMHV